MNLYKLNFDNLKIKKTILLKKDANIDDLLEYSSRHTIETPVEDFKNSESYLYFNLVDDIEEKVFNKFKEKNLKIFKIKDFAYFLATPEELHAKIKSSGYTFIDLLNEIKKEKELKK